MSIPKITEKGFVIASPELRFTPSGKAVVTVPIAFNKRRKNEQTGQWENTHSIIVRGTAWEDHAEQIAETITDRMDVLVSGEVFVREYETKDGRKGQSVEMNIFEIGPAVSKRSQGGQQQRPQQGFGQQQQDDPWGSTPGQQQGFGQANDSEPPF